MGASESLQLHPLCCQLNCCPACRMDGAYVVLGGYIPRRFVQRLRSETRVVIHVQSCSACNSTGPGERWQQLAQVHALVLHGNTAGFRLRDFDVASWPCRAPLR